MGWFGVAVVAVALASCGSDQGGSVRATGPEGDLNMATAKAQVVGTPPTALLLPTSLPADLTPEAVVPAPTQPTIGGPTSVTLYGRPGEAGDASAPVLIAITERGERSLESPAFEKATLHGRNGLTRTSGGSSWAIWRGDEDGIVGAIYARNISAEDVWRAAERAEASQRPDVPATGRPDSLEELASGDPWTGAGRFVASGFLQGTLVRWSNPTGTRTAEISAATGGDRLLRLAQSAVASPKPAKVGDSAALRGPLAFDNGMDTIAVVWAANRHVYSIVTGGLTASEVDGIVSSMRAASPDDLAGVSTNAKTFQRAAAGAKATTLFTGTTSRGTWRWDLIANRTVLVLHSNDGMEEAADDAIQSEALRADGSTGPVLSGSVQRAVSDTETFIGGRVARDISDVLLEYEDGTRATLKIVDGDSSLPIRFFGGVVPTKPMRAVLARNGNVESGRLALDN
jgi:hypothetical protein